MRGNLMRLFTPAEHQVILTQFPKNKDAAAEYTRRVPSKKFTPGNVAYWRNIFLVNDGNVAATDRALKLDRVLRDPQPDDDLGDLSFIPECAKSILVLGDIHAPYHHPDLLEFAAAVKKAFKPDLVVQIGDELDYHAMSFHDSDPNLDSAGTELEKGKVLLKALHKLFPNVLVCHSNHGSMTFRRAKHTGIPVQMIKSYREVCFPDTEAPGWSWAYTWRIPTPMGDVLFKHQKSGSLLADAAHNGANVVVGHEHGLYGIEYSASTKHLYYGVNTGCLIDKDSLAFAYGKHSLRKPVIGCVIIQEGRPFLLPMVLKPNGRWIGHL